MIERLRKARARPEAKARGPKPELRKVGASRHHFGVGGQEGPADTPGLMGFNITSEAQTQFRPLGVTPLRGCLVAAPLACHAFGSRRGQHYHPNQRVVPAILGLLSMIQSCGFSGIPCTRWNAMFARGANRCWKTRSWQRSANSLSNTKTSESVRTRNALPTPRGPQPETPVHRGPSDGNLT